MAQTVSIDDRHRIVGVCFVYRKGSEGYEYLILKRRPDLKVFPGKWTVPGGGMERAEYEQTPKTSPDGWENPLEAAVRREVREEANVEVGKFTTLGHFTFIREIDGIPVFGIRFAAEYISGEPKVDPDDATELAWIRANDAGTYDFLGNITAEIKELEDVLTAS